MNYLEKEPRLFEEIDRRLWFLGGEMGSLGIKGLVIVYMIINYTLDNLSHKNKL